MTKKILLFSFYTLFFLTPLYFNANNSELFEFSKMIIVYTLTTIITTTWIIRMLQERKFIFQRTFLDIPILLFLASQIISTITSIDIHTSLWGYYSRSNGGLLSTISYILLYYALVSNFASKEQIFRFLKLSFVSGAIAALWAILEHFGADPSCFLLRGEFNDACWSAQNNVQQRVFSTLGQPNWLAAYLAMLIFPALYFAITSKTKLHSIIYYLLSIIYYLALTFTYSRGGFIGFLVGLGVFIGGIILLWFKNKKIFSLDPRLVGSRVILPITIISFLVVNLLFASALTSFKLVKEDAAPSRPGIVSSSTSQLEGGGTESGQIRLIVWRGALDIFKHYPLFGSGVETYAYSYYNFRPLAHNMVSEWDFLYNKAHNEYLNYLATTGAFGLGTYLLLIATFIAWSISMIMKDEKGKKGSESTLAPLFILSILASYVSYLVQNVVGFSVVIIALFFYLFQAFASTSVEKFPEGFYVFKPLQLPKGVVKFGHNLSDNLVFRRRSYPQVITVILVLVGAYLCVTLIRNWQADTHYKSAQDYMAEGNPGRAYNELIDAIGENPQEPNYKSELGYAAAAAAVALQNQDATLSAQLKETAQFDTREALSISPRNVSLWTNAVLTYFELTSIDPSYQQKTLEALDKTISLAPTDPKFLYDKGVILSSLGQNQQAVAALEKAMELKPNYHDAGVTLADLYDKLGEKEKAISELQSVLKYFPADPEATQKLNTLEEK